MASSIIDSVIWRRLDTPGHDSCTLRSVKSGYELDGVAVFLRGQVAACVRYRVTCDAAWKTKEATVTGTLGKKEIAVTITRSKDHWLLNGVPQLEAAECFDVDLSFTPATNILPIKRLSLRNGSEANVNAAWLRFPSMTIAKLQQTYKKRDRIEYSYSSHGGKFKRALSLRPSGLVKSYSGLWVVESAI